MCDVGFRKERAGGGCCLGAKVALQWWRHVIQYFVFSHFTCLSSLWAKELFGGSLARMCYSAAT
jgi:hypothetical protein